MFGFSKKTTSNQQACEATVKKWCGTYGFLTRGEGTEKIFVHKSKLPSGISSLEKGQRVKVEFLPGEKGLAAEKVILL
jgi:cold shock CspA family protein